MEKHKFRSIFNVKDHVPLERIPVFNCYDNKPLSKWSHDDFAGYVFDCCDSKGQPAWDKNSFLYQIEMLDYIPESYARVYLYGVWEVIKGVFKQ